MGDASVTEMSTWKMTVQGDLYGNKDVFWGGMSMYGDVKSLSTVTLEGKIRLEEMCLVHNI